MTSISFDIAGKAAEGFIWSTVNGVYNDEIGAKFRAKYKAEFPGTMGLAYTGGGYDTTYIFANAWKAVGDPNKFKEVSDYIQATPYSKVASTVCWECMTAGSKPGRSMLILENL